MYLIYLMTLILFQNTAAVEQPSQRFLFDVQNVTCQNFTTHVKHLECDFFKIAPGRFSLNFKVLMDQKLEKDSDIRFELKFVPFNSRNSNKLLTFFDIKLKLCVAVRQQLSNVLLKGFMDEVRRTSNIPYSCPFKALTLYKIENYSLSYKLVPFYAPFSNYTYSCTIYQGGQKLYDLIVYAAVQPILKF